MGNTNSHPEETGGPQDLMSRYPEYQGFQVMSNHSYGDIQLYRNRHTNEKVCVHKMSTQQANISIDHKNTVENYMRYPHPTLCKVLDYSSRLSVRQISWRKNSAPNFTTTLSL